MSRWPRLLCLSLAAACTWNGHAQRTTPPARPTAFQYWRAIELPNKAQTPSPSACAVLDADIFAHTGATLSDIRLFTSLTQQERPFAITLSRTAETGDAAAVLNSGLKSPRTLIFDLQMPPRPYSAVDLILHAKDFLGTARVTGLKSDKDLHPTYLGVFTIFDLTSQHLGRSISLQLAESTFPLLHVEIEVQPAAGNSSLAVSPGMLTGAQIPPSRVAQTLYTPVAQTTAITQRPRQTVITFQVPARVPVERVNFQLAPAEQRNFSRNVNISARPLNAKPDASQPEQLTGSIARVRLTESGDKVDEQSLSVPAILGANAQFPATVEVAIEDGDDQPLKLADVTLEMRQRKICFGAPSPAQPEHLQIFYGGTDIAPPIYDFGRIYNPSSPSRDAVLGPERANKSYHPVVRPRRFDQKYPELLWIALIGSITTLGLVAFRSGRRH